MIVASVTCSSSSGTPATLPTQSVRIPNPLALRCADARRRPPRRPAAPTSSPLPAPCGRSRPGSPTPPRSSSPSRMLCRDQLRLLHLRPAAGPRSTAPYLTPDEVLAIARPGAGAGCHEALFTLGERPEVRYPVARDVAGRARLRLHRRLPGRDVPAGARRDRPAAPRQRRRPLPPTSWPLLRPVVGQPGDDARVAQRATSTCHRGAPDKAPGAAAGHPGGRRRAGDPVHHRDPRRHRRDPRRTASRRCEAIAASHRRHGHVQEVIVQNFLPKPGTAMRRAPPCPPDDYLWTIAAARLILPARRPPPGPAEPDRRLRRPARRRHRRLGRRLAGHRRPRQPRAPVARPRPPARR